MDIDIDISDMRTLQNCDVETFEIQTGDIKNPPNRASYNKTKMETIYFYLVKYYNCLSEKHGEKKEPS